MAINREALLEYGFGAGSGGAGLGGVGLVQYGLETGSVTLTATGGLLALSGFFSTATILASGRGRPLAGALVGSLVTLGAFELAARPVITFDSFGAANTNEKALSADEVSNIKNLRLDNFTWDC